MALKSRFRIAKVSTADQADREGRSEARCITEKGIELRQRGVLLHISAMTSWRQRQLNNKYQKSSRSQLVSASRVTGTGITRIEGGITIFAIGAGQSNHPSTRLGTGQPTGLLGVLRRNE